MDEKRQNREIKFRMWRDGKMHKLREMHTDESDNFCFQKAEQDGVIMQFTGLKDKNGKDIYEGDRIKFILENGEIEYGIVRMSEEGFWTSQLPVFMEELLSDELNSNLKYEIVGHAYDSES